MSRQPWRGEKAVLGTLSLGRDEAGVVERPVLEQHKHDVVERIGAIAPHLAVAVS
jgi:hypothetical protein